ncbi:hypothetical protein PT277_01875 [Acetobacteraceae bacterium ESL0709]|nr:hypothetical protein [Acetobacteraceae bacterium ESL0697]MDF7677449.1 hypothetical protein [Acetobacteraceae bacterium ESL0709]
MSIYFLGRLHFPFLSLLVISLIPSLSLAAVKQPVPDGTSSHASMNFSLYHATTPQEARYPGTYIFGVGTITDKTANELQTLLKKNKIDGGALYLNSMGGNYLGAMELGKLIREFDLDTYIGSYSGQKDGKILTGKGICTKACALAFLGGRYRFANSGDGYGLTRFAFPPSNEKINNADLAQRLTALTSVYVHDMGINDDFISFLTLASADTITFPDRKTMQELDIINEGGEKPVWQFKNIPDEPIYLMGAHNTLSGINKILLTCTHSGQFVMQFMFNARGNSADYYKKKIYTLHTDTGDLSLADLKMTTPLVNNNTAAISAIFSADQEEMADQNTLARLNKVLTSNTLSLTFQNAKNDPPFMAIEPFDMTTSRDLLGSYLMGCGLYGNSAETQ